MNERDPIDAYLRELTRHLARLRPEDADDVLREIRSHIDDRLDAQAAAQRSPDAAAILAGFGPARELAGRYVDHILRGSPPPPGFRAIQRVARQASRGLYWATAATGYSLAVTFFLLALLKPLAPAALGLWVDATGRVAVLGVVAQTPPGMRELLGWWMVPICLLLALAAVALTHRLLAALQSLR